MTLRCPEKAPRQRGKLNCALKDRVTKQSSWHSF
jgi:hypothetical protein